MSDDLDTDYPLLAPKSYAAESVFRPENLLREARRQKRLPDVPVPQVCVLDPDGDIVDHLSRTGAGRLQPVLHPRVAAATLVLALIPAMEVLDVPALLLSAVE